MRTIILSLTVLFCLGSANQVRAQATLSVVVEDIGSDEGMLRVGLYNSVDNWLEQVFKSKSSTIKNGKCEVTFENLPYGDYAVSVYHDENNNGKMDKYLGFYPKENYGCSNQAKAKYGPPEWKDAQFTINQESNYQHIKL